MARWKLTAKHYLYAKQFGQPSEWQREEVNVQTGRAFRRSYPVPMYIDPEDKWCINQTVGYCVIATEGSAQPGDLEVSLSQFKPTPDMEPLDDEARALSAAESPNWINPIDGLSPQMGEDFAQQLLGALQQRANGMQVSVPNAGIAPQSNEVAELKGVISAMQRQMQDMMAAFAGKTPVSDQVVEPPSVSEPDPSEQVIDNLEPLPSIEQVEAARQAAAGLAKTPLKVSNTVRRV